MNDQRRVFFARAWEVALSLFLPHCTKQVVPFR
jgi:hypothetical protein